MQLRIASITDTGQFRENNEDHFVICFDLERNLWESGDKEFTPGKFGTLMAVADGMGGQQAGEIASAIAVESLKEFYTKVQKDIITDEKRIKFFMRESVLHSHYHIVEHQKQNPETRGMGTTLLIAWVLNGHLFISWCGDSRVYLFRAAEGLIRLSRDHTYVQTLVNQGKITDEEAFFHPDGSVLTQCLGDVENPPEPDFKSFVLQQGDKIIVCTDGLCGLLQDSEISKIVSTATDVEECCKLLVENANEAGGTDNFTTIIAEIATIDSSDRKIVYIESLKKKYLWKSPLMMAVISIIVLLLVMYFFIRGHSYKDSNMPDEQVSYNISNSTVASENSTAGQIKSEGVKKLDKKLLKELKMKLENVQSTYNYLAVSLITKEDSLSNKILKSHLANLSVVTKKTKPERVCKEIDLIYKSLKNLTYPPNANFDNKVKALVEMKGKICGN
jgi:PPM family protein phosphatase